MRLFLKVFEKKIFADAQISKKKKKKRFRRKSINAVRTTRPEKCDIFAQRYQSQPITTKFQKHC